MIVPPRGLPGRPPGRSPPPAARCWCSTRCRPASAAPAPGSPSSAAGIVPDVVTLAKGLGGGLPIGACIGIGDGRRPARTRPARHDVRRQPGLLRRGARRARHDRRRGPARARHAGRQGDHRRRRGARPPAGRRGHGAGLLIGIGLTEPVVRGGRGGRPRTRVPGQQRGAGPGPARPAAGAHRGPGGRVPRRAARPSWTPDRFGRTTMIRHLDPARRRPEPGRAAGGARPGRRDEGRPVRLPPAGRAHARWRCCSTRPPPGPGVSFEVGIAQLGGTPADHRHRGQPARPRARPSPTPRGCCPGYVDAIVWRTGDQSPDRGAGRRVDRCRW